MHEVFLCRLANHPVFRNDHNFRVFLEYEQDVLLLLLFFSIYLKLIYHFLALRAREEQEREIGNIPQILLENNG